MIFNTAGELLAMKRPETMRLYPGLLDIGVSCACQDGEGYPEAALRTVAHFFGVECSQLSSNLQKLFTFPYEDEHTHVWGCAFTLEYDGPVCSNMIYDSVEFWDCEKFEQELRERPDSISPLGKKVWKMFADETILRMTSSDFEFM